MSDDRQHACSPAGTEPPRDVCPWWLGHLLASPLRKLFEPPDALLGAWALPGMTVLEPGCGMGYFTLPLARMVGPTGRVVCVDLQPRMLDGLRKRARRAGLQDRIEASVCSSNDLGIDRWRDRIDHAVAIHMIHEVLDQAALLRQIHATLRPGGTLLCREPKGHVTESQFAVTLAAAADAGFIVGESVTSGRSLGAILRKPGTPPHST